MLQHAVLPGRRGGQLHRPILLSGSEQGGVDVDDILAVPAQGHRTPRRRLGGTLQGFAPEEVMIEAHRPIPIHLEGVAKPGPHVHGVDTATAISVQREMV